MINYENNMDQSTQPDTSSDIHIDISPQSSTSFTQQYSTVDLDRKINSTSLQYKQMKIDICKLNLEIKLLELEIMKKKLSYAKITQH